MTRLGFLIIFVGVVLIVLGAAGVIESDIGDILPVLAIVIGSLAIAVDEERDDGDPIEKPDQVPLGGGGRLGPMTRIGFVFIAAGAVLIVLRILDLIDTEVADIASALAVVIGALIVAVDGEREIPLS